MNPTDGKAQCWLLVGKSKRGKSHFAEWLIRDHMSHRDPKLRWRFGVVFTMTAGTGQYSWMPKKFIREFSVAAFVTYMKGLRKLRERTKKPLPMNFCYLDDCHGLLSSRKVDEELESVWATSRQWNTNLIIADQYMAQGVPTTLRAQCDYAVLWKTHGARTLKALWGEFGQLWTYEEFCGLMEERTAEQYSAVLFRERIDTREGQLIPIMAPAQLPKTKLVFDLKKS
jgi:hypothetical protein